METMSWHFPLLMPVSLPIQAMATFITLEMPDMQSHWTTHFAQT
jgi:hypothetical protein